MILYYSSLIYEKILLSVGYLLKKQIRNSPEEKPIFIVSAGRSGSTLLRKYLLQTGLFNIPPESEDLIPAIAKVFIKNIILPWNFKIHKILSLLKKSDNLKIWDINLIELHKSFRDIPVHNRNLATIIKLIYGQYAKQFGPPNSPYWGDKTPYLILRLPWILLIFPNAKIVHIIRDPRAVILSRQKEFGESLDYSIKRWQWAIASISKIKDKNHIFEIKFEDLVVNTKETLDKTLTYISNNLSYEKKVENVYLGDDHYKHHKNLSNPLMINKVSEWEEKILIEDRAIIESKLLKEMEYYGYKL
jgi:hypothetical protein